MGKGTAAIRLRRESDAMIIALPLSERLNIKKHFSYVIDVNSYKGGKENNEIYDRVASFFRVAHSSKRKPKS